MVVQGRLRIRPDLVAAVVGVLVLVPFGAVAWGEVGLHADVLPLPAVQVPTGLRVPIACAENDYHYFRAVVAHPPPGGRFTPPRADSPEELRDAIAAANTGLFLDAASRGADLRLLFLCDETGEVQLDEIVMPTLDPGFWEIREAVEAAGLLDAPPGVTVNVLVLANLFPDPACGRCGGLSQVYDDDRPGRDNLARNGGLVSVAYVQSQGLAQARGAANSGGAILHELFHAMGAVQHSAPHSSGKHHCTDGPIDLMCTGPAPGCGDPQCMPMQGICTGLDFKIDCGHDDYFDPFPATGSYLATHWNVGSPWNPYLRRAPTAPLRTLMPHVADVPCTIALCVEEHEGYPSWNDPACRQGAETWISTAVAVRANADCQNRDGESEKTTRIFVDQFEWRRDADGQCTVRDHSLGIETSCPVDPFDLGWGRFLP